MTIQPFFTILINNYNYARFLKKTILSALSQRYEKFEVIVVDDASTDHSTTIIKQFEERVKAIYLPTNRGQGAAFNAGWEASQGDYIALLDADDIFLENKLSVLAETIANYPDAEMIYNRGHRVDPNLQILDANFPKNMPEGNLHQRTLKLCETGFPPTSFLTFKKSFLDRIFPINAYLNKVDADFPLQMLSALLAKVVAVKEILTLYRLHGDNWFSNNEFAELSIPDIKHLVKRTERSFYFINQKLSELHLPYRLEPTRHRHHRRNLYILHEIKPLRYFIESLKRPHFESIMEFYDYFMWGFQKRREFLRFAEKL